MVVQVGLAELILAMVGVVSLGFVMFKVSQIRPQVENPTIKKLETNQNKIVEDVNESFGVMSDRMADLEDALMALIQQSDEEDDKPKAKVGFKKNNKEE